MLRSKEKIIINKPRHTDALPLAGRGRRRHLGATPRLRPAAPQDGGRRRRQGRAPHMRPAAAQTRGAAVPEPPPVR